MFVSSHAVVIALAATIASASVKVDDGKPAPKVSVESVSAPVQLATLGGVKAVPMTSRELGAVKGTHAHFATPSQNELFGMTGFHVANRNNMDNWLDLGNGELVGPSYHGLCGAALNSPKMFIPGQNPDTGIGGGC